MPDEHCRLFAAPRVPGARAPPGRAPGANMTDESRITQSVDPTPRPPRAESEERDQRPRSPRFGRDYRRDSEHLKILSIFYFVFCGLNSIALLGGVLYMAIGLAMVIGGSSGGPNASSP